MLIAILIMAILSNIAWGVIVVAFTTLAVKDAKQKQTSENLRRIKDSDLYSEVKRRENLE